MSVLFISDAAMKKNAFVPASTNVALGKAKKKTLKNEDIENVSRSVHQERNTREETNLRGYQRTNAA